MNQQTQRKIKISLSDYSYRKDLDIRLFMAQLSSFEVTVLQEIIHHSLTISIHKFADELSISPDSLIPLLDKLAASQLFKRDHLTLFVDKEVRKTFEFQLQRFDNDFVPDLEFVQQLLNNVPIHLLPFWYVIPRTSTHIFASIVEKYFSTPKIYIQYLNELQFDNPLLHSILKEVYQSPQFKVKATDIMSKFEMTREYFEECILLLEYHFVCCMSYNKTDEGWAEVVSPFAELREFLIYESQAKAHAISEPIEMTLDQDFSFISDLSNLIKNCQTKKSDPSSVKNLHAKTAAQLQRLVEKLIQVEFVSQGEDRELLATEKGISWISLAQSDQIAHLATDPLNRLIHTDGSLWNIRNLHMIEKKLRRLTPHEWVELDRFIQGFIAPIGDKEPVTLKKKGKKWKYEVPFYSENEKQFIRAVVLERLAQLGVVDTGIHKGKEVFCLTPFGSQFIH